MKKIYPFVAICFLTNINAFAQVPCQTTLTSAIGTDAQSICDGIAMTDITYQVSGTNASANGLPNGVSGSYSGNVFTISGTPSAPGVLSKTFTYTITTTGGCITDSSVTGSIEVHLKDNMAGFSYLDNPYCQKSDNNPSPFFCQTVIAPSCRPGIFSASSNDLVFNSSSGRVDLTLSLPGTYTVTNTIAAANGCPEGKATDTIRINAALPLSVNDTTICSGGTAILVANGTNGYLWSNGATTNSITVSPTVTTTYSVTGGTGKCNIAVVATVNVQGDDATFSYSPSTICKTGGTDPIPTTTTSGGTFSCSNASLVMNTSSGLINLASTPIGTYTVTYTTAGQCPASSDFIVSIVNVPFASFSYAGPLCSNGTNAIPTYPPGSTAGIFSAAPTGLVFVNTGTGTINLPVSTAGTYTVSNTITGGGCSTTKYDTIITIDPPPTVAVTSTTICAGNTATLTAAGATTYFWSDGSAGGTLTASPVSTTSYIVTGTTLGCSSSAVGTITVYALPVITTSDASICRGQSATLTANGGINYSWSPGGFNTSSINVSPTATTSFTVIGTGVTAVCTGQAVATVTVIQTPVITVNSPTICQGSSATLTASGGNAYFWSPGGGVNTPSINVTPTITTSYTVTGTTGGCSGHAVGTVTVEHEPVLMPGGTDFQTICINNPILEIPYDVFLSYTVIGLPPGVSFQYNTGNHSLKISGTPTVAGVYTYTLAPQSGACNLSTAHTGTITVKPLSSSTTNPGGCDGLINISGNVYHDNNSDCTKDVGDQGIDNIHLKLYNANNTLLAHKFTSAGAYDFTIWDSTGIYTVELDVDGQSLSAQCPSPGLTSTVTITTANPQVSNVDFNLQCNADYGIQSIFTSGRVFPGQQHQLNVYAGDMNDLFNLNCPATSAGTLQITVNGPVTYNYSAPGALSPTVQGNTFTYTINNWATVNMQQDFRLMFTTHTTAQANDSICVSVVLTTLVNDINAGNNTYHFCYAVRNSYDPNLKEVYPVDVEPGFADWLTYTIHFQNTGNDSAINIRLKDTLDAQLNLETFQVLNYSHANIISIYENLLTVYYPNIQLPDSISDPTGSQGFVQYRLKPKANLTLGTQIKNTANIYFDYNAPIRTNTTVNECKAAITSITENKQNTLLRVYPNPNNGAFTVKSTNEGVYSIINELGQILQQLKLSATNQYTVNIENLSDGIYFIVGDSIQQKIVVIE